MDLKFTFNGGQSDNHDHGGEGSHSHGAATHGIPLTFAGATQSLGSTSSALEMQVSIGAHDDGAIVRCEGVSGDGVTYGRAEKMVKDTADVSALASATRSVIARAGAEMPEPLIGSVSSITLSLGGAEAAVIGELGLSLEAALDPAAPVSSVDERLQARTGVAVGTPVKIAR